MNIQFLYTEKISNKLRANVTKESFRYIHQPKFVFLCGAGVSNGENRYQTKRGIVGRYINNKKDAIFCVWSEDLWMQNSSYTEEIDLLTFEEFLAELCDYIIIFVESFGSACELGAFTLKDKKFIRKMLIVLDKRRENDASFINQGPVAKARKNDAKIIYIDFEKALMGENIFVSEIDKMLNSFDERSAQNKINKNDSEQKINISSFVIEILEIIKILEPISQEDVIIVYKCLKGFKSFSFAKKDGTHFNSNISIGYIFRFLEKIGLIKKEDNKYSVTNVDLTLGLLFGTGPFRLSKLRSRLIALQYKYRCRGNNL